MDMIPSPTSSRPGSGSTGPWSATASISRPDYLIRSKIRHILSNYNADRKDLSRPTAAQLLQGGPPQHVDRFAIKQLWAE